MPFPVPMTFSQAPWHSFLERLFFLKMKALPPRRTFSPHLFLPATSPFRQQLPSPGTMNPRSSPKSFRTPCLLPLTCLPSLPRAPTPFAVFRPSLFQFLPPIPDDHLRPPPHHNPTISTPVQSPTAFTVSKESLKPHAPFFLRC